jgi:phosphatidylglycerol---prolipoprotein diacylglyceryl transferase
MYPGFEYVFERIFQTAVSFFLGTFKTFGFFVALAFLAAACVLKKELRRKEVNISTHLGISTGV